MYEHRKQPLATKQIFYRRIIRSILVASFIMLICLLIGVAGTDTYEQFLT